MLKFLRKYQMLILVVGGTLLMVVFLLEPIISRLAPSPDKARAATMGPAGSVTRGDLARASEDVQALERFLPVLTGPTLLALDPDRPERHWLLLTTEAKRQGFIGEAGDGEDWLPELAVLAAQGEYLGRLQQQFGNQVSPQIAQMLMNTPQGRQQLEELSVQIRPILSQRLDQLAGGMPRGSRDRVSQILSDARGVLRMLNFYQRTPRLSDAEAVAAAKDALDSVIVDVAILSGSSVAASVPAPSESELEAFFAEYRQTDPAESPLGVGYVLPPRVKLAELTLDAEAIAAAVPVDRIELNKLWRQDRTRYPGEFADERPNVERDYVNSRVRDLLVEADRFFRAEVAKLTRGLQRRGAYVQLPDDWQTPSMDDLALRVQRSVTENTGVEFPLPLVRVYDDRFRTPVELQSLPVLGRSVFQIGSRTIPMALLPTFVREVEPSNQIAVQVGVPLADAAAVDATGSRHYVLVLAARPRGAAESIDEAGRDRVLEDYREVRAYERLVASESEILAAAAAGGLEAASAAAGATPDVTQNVTVQRDQASDGRVNTAEFREAVRSAGAALDPFASPRSAEGPDAFVLVELPGSRSVAVARLVAARPLTEETFDRVAAGSVMREMTDQITSTEGFVEKYPFSLAALTRRLDFKMVKGEDDDAPAAGTPAGSDSTPTPAG
jgi:hypothetical protein